MVPHYFKESRTRCVVNINGTGNPFVGAFGVSAAISHNPSTAFTITTAMVAAQWKPVFYAFCSGSPGLRGG